MRISPLIFATSMSLSACSDPIRQTAGFAFLTAGVAVASLNGREPFQPPPSDEERWHKPGANSTEITSALLECGDVSPRSARFKNEPRMTPNEVVLMNLCMEASGFTSDFEASAIGYCTRLPISKPAACEPGTPAPARDVSKRLNSAFCNAYPKADVCGSPDAGVIDARRDDS